MKHVECDYYDVWYYEGYEIVKFTDADDLQVSTKEGNVIGYADSLQDATSFIDDHINF